MNAPKKLIASTLAATLLASTASWAFCGFYVATADEPLTNKASRVVLVRDGDHTAITMASDVHGDQKQFALVIPVPTVIKREQVRVVKPETVQTLADYSKARLVEYYDRSPCPQPPPPPAAPIAAAPAREMSAPGMVRVEAAYAVEEYDIQVLASDKADALIPWLNQNGYRIPADAGPVIQSYIGQGMHFFVAKVNLERAKANASGMLRPIQVSYETRKFMLPIRLGTVNATGPQDMIMLAITRKGRVETTNYQTTKMPTGVNVPTYVKDRFAQFYDATFENAVRRKGGGGVFLEYAWPIPSAFYGDQPVGVMCDPCTGPTIQRSQMQELGVTWTTDMRDGQERASTSFITRLHVRYDRERFPEDLQLQETNDTEQYQARYVINHHEVPYASLQCYEGYQYASVGRPKKWAEEKRNAIDLTGWKEADVANAMSAQWAKDKPE